MHHRRTRGLWLAIAILLTACDLLRAPSISPSAGVESSPPASASASGPISDEYPVVLAAGDIAACDSRGDEATATLLDELDGTILALGDLAYEEGTAEQFADCYDPTWGRHRDRTQPVPGNHEYETKGAAPYFDYFGPVAGDPDEGWYALDLGEWHVIGLNSNCDEVGGCGADSAQATWLEGDLAANSAFCTLAFWHHPRWSSGEEHGSDDRTDAFWRLLSDAGADVVLAGHDHQYERFEPMARDGAADPDGMVEFVVGTGGRSLYEFGAILPTSAVHDGSTYGVLKLTLRPHAYDWEFIPASEGGFTDAGTAACR